MTSFDVLTLVPEAFDWFLNQHPVADAASAGVVDLRVHDIREYTPLSHATVDDTPYGGGPGMVIRVDVVAAALEGVFGVAADAVRDERDVFVLAPGGHPFDDQMAGQFAATERDIVLLSGRYEGFDARVSELLATGELSVGPFVLAGGEVAAMVVLEATVRRIPGALGNVESLAEESFSAGLAGGAEYPQYTRPRVFKGAGVPDVLLSGNHAAIARWRREQARPSGWSKWGDGDGVAR